MMNALMMFGQILKSCRIIIQQELQKLTKILQRDLILKFPVKTRDIHKIEKKNSIIISGFAYENKVKYPIYLSKKLL